MFIITPSNQSEPFLSLTCTSTLHCIYPSAIAYRGCFLGSLNVVHLLITPGRLLIIRFIDDECKECLLQRSTFHCHASYNNYTIMWKHNVHVHMCTQNVHVYVYMYVCTVRTDMYTCTHMYMYMYMQYTCTCIHVVMCICMHIHVHEHVTVCIILCICTCTCTCILDIHVPVHVHVHVQVYTVAVILFFRVHTRSRGG